MVIVLASFDGSKDLAEIHGHNARPDARYLPGRTAQVATPGRDATQDWRP